MKATINTTLLAKLAPKDKPYDVWDEKLTGFHLRVYPTGKCVYRCMIARGKIGTIGSAQIITVVQARDKARIILGEAAVGINSTQQSKSRESNKITFKVYIENEYGP